MWSEQDAAYMTGKFSSCGFDENTYRSAVEDEDMMATGIRFRSFHFEVEGLPNGMNALHRMCADNQPASVQLLINQDGLNINTCGICRMSPLFAAAQEGREEVVRALLARPGVAGSQSTSVGAIPLHAAATYGHAEVVRALLAHSPGTSL